MARAGSQAGWDELAELDPYWAILSEPAARDGSWDREAFMRSGDETVARVLAAGESFGRPRAHGDALDFGCGLGRLTQALAPHFERCVGVDHSARMVSEARVLAAGLDRCRFAVLDGPRLDGLSDASFDLVLSRLVLQHIPTLRAKESCIGELIRVLRPGGLLAFQLPSRIPVRHRVQPRPRAYALLRRAGLPPEPLYRRLRLHPIRMTAMARPRVLRLLGAAGGRVLEATDETDVGGVISTDYLVTRDE